MHRGAIDDVDRAPMCVVGVGSDVGHVHHRADGGLGSRERIEDLGTGQYRVSYRDTLAEDKTVRVELSDLAKTKWSDIRGSPFTVEVAEAWKE